MADNLAGLLLGQYQAVERIGQGGMGSVYKAYQPSLDRHVAIKVLTLRQASSPDFLERFRREARAIARLEHPSILSIFDFGEQDGIPFIVMPLIAGGTLRTRVGVALPLDWAIETCRPIAQALDYAHSRGVLHRDVKPANVLLGPAGRPLLADFGLAKLAGERGGLTADRVAIGTPEYMSPEQCQGGALDGGTDLYGLATIVFEILTGRVPYSGISLLEVAFKQVHEPVPSLQLATPGITREVDLVVQRALAKDRRERFASCTEFIEHLRTAARHQGPSTATIAYPFGALPLSMTTSLMDTQPDSRGPWTPRAAGDPTAPVRPHGRSPRPPLVVKATPGPVAGGADARVTGQRQSSRSRRWSKWWYVAALASVIPALLAWGTTAPSPSRPLVPMTGLVNVAIAEFGQIDPRGQVVRWDPGDRLSESVYTRLQAELQTVPQLSGVVQVKHEGVGLVQGSSQTERADVARSLASKLSAQVLVYGHVDQRENQAVFTPEFFVSGLAGAEELAGISRLGTPVATPSAGDPLGYLLPLSDALRARTEALTLFTVGLTYFIVGNPASAVDYFERAKVVEPWADAEGKEIIYLFLGTALRGRGGPGDSERAKEAFATAVRLNPDYSRARIALGNLYYDEYRLDGQGDLGKLEQSIREYETAARTKTGASTVDAKVVVSLGNAYVVKAQVGNPEFFVNAQSQFQRVVEQFERGDSTIDAFASHAYLGLGIVSERAEGDLVRAADFYRKSMALASGNKDLWRLAAAQLEVVEQRFVLAPPEP